MKLRLKKKLRQASAEKGVFVADTLERCEQAVRMITNAGVIGVDTESIVVDKDRHPKGRTRVFTAQFARRDGQMIFVPNYDDAEGNIRVFKKWLESETQLKTLHNAKWDMHVLGNHGIRMRGLKGDTMVMDYLKDTGEMFHGLKECIRRYFGEHTMEYRETFARPKIGKRGNELKQMVVPPLDEVVRQPGGYEKLFAYATKDPLYSIRLYDYLAQHLASVEWVAGKSYLDYYEQFELPYTEVLYEVERRGCLLDMAHLDEMKVELSEDMQTLEEEFIRQCVKAGVDILHLQSFNMNSGAQIGKLFEQWLGVELSERTPTGKPKTDDNALSTIKGKGKKIAGILLEHRRLSKFLGTYVEPMLASAPLYKNRVHTTLKQIGTACMPSGELVLTSRGYLPVEDVEIGDLVLTHEGRSRPVVQTILNGVKPIYCVTLDNGLSLRTTGNHKYWTSDGSWVRADQLTHGHDVCVHSDPEEWAKIPQWEDWSVSTWGRVMNDKTGRLATPRPKGRWGHLKVCLYRNGAQRRGSDRKDFSVHRLVARVFPTDGRGPEVRHVNGVSWDNTVDNLLFGTRTENAQDAVRHDSLRWTGKLSDEQVNEIRGTEYVRGDSRVNREGTDYVLARKFGVCREMIGQVRRGTRKMVGVAETVTWRTARVVSVVKQSSEMTYGLTVDEDHSHVTGGIVTHNTGRLSSSGPNLQNIPASDKDHYGIRRAFIAPKGMVVGDIDLSNIELRLMAHFSKDKAMLEALSKGWNLHSLTATRTFEDSRAFIGAQAPTKELLEEVKHKFEVEYKRAKVLNFGVGYGMGPQAYSRLTGESERAGEEAIRNFYSGYPGLKGGIQAAQHSARMHGHVRTLLMRYAHIEGANSPVMGIRKAAERRAWNYRIQGSAADMLKMSMILIERSDRLRELGVKMTLQIHDELLFEVPKGAEKETKTIVDDLVSRPYKHFGFRNLAIDTPAEMGFGPSWADAKQ